MALGGRRRNGPGVIRPREIAQGERHGLKGGHGNLGIAKGNDGMSPGAGLQHKHLDAVFQGIDQPDMRHAMTSIEGCDPK